MFVCDLSTHCKHHFKHTHFGRGPLLAALASHHSESIVAVLVCIQEDG